MHKKDAPDATHRTLNVMVKQDCVNSDFDACDVSKHLFGKHLTIDTVVDNIGSKYGSQKVIAFVNCPLYLDIANQLSGVLKTFGCLRYPKKAITMLLSNISFTMQHIFIRMGALLTS